jgi:fumarate reductase subunit C
MAGPAHPHAMAPPKPGRTRTAPPQTPSTWWGSKRILTYLLFDATGIIYFLLGFGAIAWFKALAAGPAAFHKHVEAMSTPGMIALHALCLVSVVFVAVRFFRLFPKAQPPAIGPMKPPPGPVIHATLYVAWLGITVVFGLILAGVLFP